MCLLSLLFFTDKQNTVDVIKTLLAIRIFFLWEYQNRTDILAFFPTNVLPFPKKPQVFTKCAFFSDWQGESTNILKLRDMIQMAKNEDPASKGKLTCWIPAAIPGRKKHLKTLCGCLRHPRTCCYFSASKLAFFSAQEHHI